MIESIEGDASSASISSVRKPTAMPCITMSAARFQSTRVLLEPVLPPTTARRPSGMLPGVIDVTLSPRSGMKEAQT